MEDNPFKFAYQEHLVSPPFHLHYFEYTTGDHHYHCVQHRSSGCFLLCKNAFKFTQTNKLQISHLDLNPGIRIANFRKEKCGTIVFVYRKIREKILKPITVYVISGLYVFKRFSDINTFVLLNLFMSNLVPKLI